MSIEPTDADFDDMHHALGRPDGPHVEPYRNAYCCGTDDPTAKRFEALGLWEKGGQINQGSMTYYRVTDEGRRLIMAWLVERQRRKGVRPWIVTGDGLTPQTVIAKSASAARFHVYRDISDVYSFDGGFRGFLRLGVKARAA